MIFNDPASVTVTTVNLTPCFATYNQLIHPRFSAKLFFFKVKKQPNIVRSTIFETTVVAAAVRGHVNPCLNVTSVCCSAIVKLYVNDGISALKFKEIT